MSKGTESIRYEPTGKGAAVRSYDEKCNGVAWKRAVKEKRRFERRWKRVAMKRNGIDTQRDKSRRIGIESQGFARELI